MTERQHTAVIRRHIAAMPALVWALVADTNRFDRAAGFTPGKYEFRLLRADEPDSRANVATAKQMGFDIAWIEPPYEWIEGRHVRGERTFIQGPINRGGFMVDLTPDGNGTRLEASTWIAGDGMLAGALGIVMKAKFKAALQRYVDAIESVLTRQASTTEFGWSVEPPSSIARRQLMVSATDEVTSGRVSPINDNDFEFRARRFAAAPIDAAVREKLLEFLRTRPDEEVAQMRPFEIAQAWSLDRREVLRGFLHAARAGLVDLHWQINCPTCRVPSSTATSLDTLGREAHCGACNIEFGLDFAEHVEAVFKVNVAVRKVETALYCAASPWFRPHVFAQVRVPAKSTREFETILPPGMLLIRTLNGRRRALIDVAGSPPAVANVRVTGDALTLAGSGETDGGKPTKVAIQNDSNEEVLVVAERSGWSSDIVLGSVIATLPDFLDLFASEAPAAGVELTVSALTLLFSDLTGSTAMYEKMGDARAFAIVQEHFRLMEAAITTHNGGIVKTMGDSVMATFSSPADAMQAALQMVRDSDTAHAAIGLSVKIGLHEGPCLAVRANDRLDFFGTTVNVAARLQAQAHGQQIVVMKDLLAHTGVSRIVRDAGFPMTEFTAHLKGIRQEQELIAVDAGSKTFEHAEVAQPKARVG